MNSDRHQFPYHVFLAAGKLTKDKIIHPCAIIARAWKPSGVILLACLARRGKSRASGCEGRRRTGRASRAPRSVERLSQALVRETDIHHPTDNTLLWDVVRVVTRLLGRLAKALEVRRIKGMLHLQGLGAGDDVSGANRC